MRISYPLLTVFAVILGGCSSTSLIDAIEKSGTQNVEILFQDDSDNVVLFLNEDDSGQPMLSLNTYSKDSSRFKYDSGTGEHAQRIELTDKYEIIRVTSVGRSSFGALWGGIFNYPNAVAVSYTLEDLNGNEIYKSQVELTETNIVYEKLPEEILEQMDSLHYKILDATGDIIVEW
jgi:hypothetical protein